MRDLESEVFTVVYVGKRQYSEVESRFSVFGLEVEALKAGQIGVRGRLADLRVAIEGTEKKLFALQGIPEVAYSGPEILAILETADVPVSSLTSWPPKPDSSTYFGPDDEDVDEDLVEAEFEFRYRM